MFSVLSLSRRHAFGMFNSGPNDHIAAVCAGHSATDQNDFFRFAHLHDLKILNSDALATQVTWHSLILPNAARCRTIADGADAPVGFRTVSRALPREIVLLHHALKAFSLRSANHIDIIAWLKLRHA